MMKKLIVCLIMLAIQVAFAGEEEDGSVNPSPKHLVTTKVLATKAAGKVHVVLRNDGHVLAKPFMVEFRPECKGKQTDWKQLRVADMESACKVEINSLAVNDAKGEITVKLYETDAEDYRRRSERSPGEVVPKCLNTPTVFTVNVANLCRN